MKFTVIDYGRGNLFSLGGALDHLGAEHETSESPEAVLGARGLILPGVGAFGDAMDGLRRRGLVEPIRQAAEAGVPLLGICLGMQLLVSVSEEFGQHEGLDLIPGTVRRLPEADGGLRAIRIPNVGWRAIKATSRDTVFGDFGDSKMYYFVHSYTPVLEDPAHVIATTPVNGMAVAAIIRRAQIIGCQFHPEKSGPAGLSLLRRFLEFAEAGREAA